MHKRDSIVDLNPPVIHISKGPIVSCQRKTLNACHELFARTHHDIHHPEMQITPNHSRNRLQSLVVVDIGVGVGSAGVGTSQVAQSLGSRVGSSSSILLHGLDDTLALVLGLILSTPEVVTKSLSVGLLRVGLNGGGSAVVDTGNFVADLLGGGLLRVGLEGLLELVGEGLAG